MLFRNEIDKKLLPLFKTKRCAILDVPTYANVGDQLIWSGMEVFFENNKIECVYRSSCNTFLYKELPTDVTICLVGGGNFGDLWRRLQELRNAIIKLYPNHKIVIFPQSVYYSDMSICANDSILFAQHKDLHICARDYDSYSFLLKHFRNSILLVPDMVLYLSFESNKKYDYKILFLKREDKEQCDYADFIKTDMVVCDWPTHEKIDLNHQKGFMKRYSFYHRMLKFTIKMSKKMDITNIYRVHFASMLHLLNDDKIPIKERWEIVYMEINYLLYLNRKFSGRLNEIINTLLYEYHLPLIKSYAIKFLQQYDIVYSTRLHGGILAMLLGKKVFFIDNNYGKIKSLYNTWLLNEPNVEMKGI